MKRIAKPFLILLLTATLMASCLGDDGNYDFTFYSDTAITSFSLGELNRNLMTKAGYQFNEDGTPADSAYVETVDGSKYVFYIDQVGRRIYNPDSLPTKTDAAHVICSVNSKNSGIIVIKDVESDTLRYYSEEDSIDFTVPREFRVYSIDGASHRSYTISVNVHEEDPDSFVWHDNGAHAALAAMTPLKVLEHGGRVLVYGQAGGAMKVCHTDMSDGVSWTETTLGQDFDVVACEGVTAKGETLYTIGGGSLMTSVDGLTWTRVETNGEPALARMLGASRRKLYAASAAGDILSSDNDGASWTTDELAADKAGLPVENVSLACVPLATNVDAERVILIGNRSLDAYPADSVAMAWNKVEEYGENSESHKWIPCDEDNNRRLPRLHCLSVSLYGGLLTAVGGHGLGESTAEAFSKVYTSKDNGLTWHDAELYTLPENLTAEDGDTFVMTVDKENCLWIIRGDDGRVWRGRLNKLGWPEYQTSFTK